MNLSRRPTPLSMLAAAILAAFVTIHCSGSGSPGQPTTTAPAVPAVPSNSTVAISSIGLSATGVVGGNAVTGTATLTGAAPAGGAMVTLSGGDPVSVQPTVTVPAGSAAATFMVSTRAVAGTIASTISGAYGGASASAVLSVMPFVPTMAIANFGITGTSITDTCALINNGNSLDCFFDGSTSTAPGAIVAWDWSYTVATTISQTTSGPRLAVPAASCALVPMPPLPAGAASFTMIVKLKIHDSLGNVSAEAVNSARLLPQGACGF
jgi:hypothetical protein